MLTGIKSKSAGAVPSGKAGVVLAAPSAVVGGEGRVFVGVGVGIGIGVGIGAGVAVVVAVGAGVEVGVGLGVRKGGGRGRGDRGVEVERGGVEMTARDIAFDPKIRGGMRVYGQDCSWVYVELAHSLYDVCGASVHREGWLKDVGRARLNALDLAEDFVDYK